MATLKDIRTASLIYLTTTVSRVSIATRAYLSEETRHRVLTVAEELGYTKHLKGQS